MTLPIQYTYLFGSGIFIIPWIIIFFLRKDLRELLWQCGLLFAGLGLIGEYFWWTKDWWKPYTVTNTIIGIEDVILGFFSTGVIATLYLVVFKKKFIRNAKVEIRKTILRLGGIIVINIALFAGLFNLGVNSFTATFVTCLFASMMLLSQKRKLIIPASINGFLTMILVTPVYFLMLKTTPTFVEKVWMTENLIGKYWWGVPIEDYIFYYAAGVICFCVYPFYKDARIGWLNE